jgi:hypothetical protein
LACQVTAELEEDEEGMVRMQSLLLARAQRRRGIYAREGRTQKRRDGNEVESLLVESLSRSGVFPQKKRSTTTASKNWNVHIGRPFEEG